MISQTKKEVFAGCNPRTCLPGGVSFVVTSLGFQRWMHGYKQNEKCSNGGKLYDFKYSSTCGVNVSSSVVKHLLDQTLVIDSSLVIIDSEWNWSVFMIHSTN
jgi:hypothetical protein